MKDISKLNLKGNSINDIFEKSVSKIKYSLKSKENNYKLKHSINYNNCYNSNYIKVRSELEWFKAKQLKFPLYVYTSINGKIVSVIKANSISLLKEAISLALVFDKTVIIDEKYNH
ncbi:hypothetical protein [Mycoplasma sp. P36-A1]|uniref:hypothetical protein n=1 Tax=Mycoplasma sp. P36-A1 TaxID=3252900 RepID=UPI003C2F01B0